MFGRPADPPPSIGSAGLASVRLPVDGWGVTPSEQLCLACGLCCDGTLFDNVQLGAGDDPQQLKTLGVPVFRSRARKPATLFRQPCAALCADRTCRIYADRPQQCRDFECGVFKDFRAGRLEFSAALRQVKRARHQANGIRDLLRALGDTEEHRSLSARFRRTQQRIESEGTDPATADIFAKLSQAFHAFHLLKHEKFYTRVEAG